MSGVNYLNTHGIYYEQDSSVKENINLKLLWESLPEICQFVGTGTLLIMSNFQSMRSLIFKAQRKSLIRLGSGLACIIMGIALGYDCYLTFVS